VCGDAVGVWQDELSTLVSVIDGLGSGDAAARAAHAALACVESKREQPLGQIVADCHKALQGSRGAVMALVRVEHDCACLTYVGVGGIGFSAASAKPMQPVPQSGVVGHRLPRLAESRFDCTAGDLVVLYSDGIGSRFLLRGGVSALRWAPPEELAQRIVKRYGQDDDVAVAVLMMTVGGTDPALMDPASILSS
jgi:hypothetical protein